MLESLDLPFVQRGLAEVALLSVGAGLIGTWVVLRGLAFHSHAVGTAAFPGLVLADGLGFAAALGALGAAAAFAVLVSLLARRRTDDRGAEVALVLVGMIALGVILASDVFESSAALETLLFGSLFLIDNGELALAGVVSALALGATLLVGQHWLAHGFDAEGESRGRPWLEPALLALVALATAAAVTAVGALLVAALFVVPAATTRLWTSRMTTWQIATVALCAAEGMAGVVLSVELNAPPGATIALLAGAAFAVSAVLATIRRGAGRTGKPLSRWAAAGAALFLISGCGSDSADGVSVVATTPVAGDLTANVAGDDVEVTTLMSPDTDPHEYEPRPDDVEALANADLVVASGAEVDEWIDDAVADAGSEAELLVLIDQIPHRLGEDPHWWHDPRNAAAAAERIGETLADEAPDSATTIEPRTTDYVAEVEAIDRDIGRCFSALPPAQRKIVTDHDAFAYLAERYDLEIVGTVIPAVTTEAQASAGELAELRETIEREGVQAIFPESSSNEGLAEVLASETGTDTGGALFGDSLGPAGAFTGTYLGMETANAAALVSGLTGGAQECAF